MRIPRKLVLFLTGCVFLCVTANLIVSLKGASDTSHTWNRGINEKNVDSFDCDNENIAQMISDDLRATWHLNEGAIRTFRTTNACEVLLESRRGGVVRDLFSHASNIYESAAPSVNSLPINDRLLFFETLRMLRTCLAPKRTVGICAIQIGEGYIVQQWLAHYLLLGVTKFYIFDNGSPTAPETVLFHAAVKIFVDESIVEIIPWYHGGEYRQVDAYNKCFSDHKKDFDFLLFVDLDEFLVLKPPLPICFSDLLSEEFMETPGISIPMRLFSPVGVPRFVPSVLVLSQFRFDGVQDVSGSTPVKSVVRTTFPVTKINVHIPHFVNTTTTWITDVDGVRIPLDARIPFRSNIYEKIELRHYKFRSWELAISDKVCGSSKERISLSQLRYKQLKTLACSSQKVFDQETQHDGPLRVLISEENTQIA